MTARSPSQGLVLGNASLTQGHRGLLNPGEEHGPGRMRMDRRGGAEAAPRPCQKAFGYKDSRAVTK